MRTSILTLVFSFFIFNSLFGQVDTIETEYDTIVYIENPHVIRKTVTVEEPIEFDPSWAVEASGGTNYFASYFDVCESCQGLFDTIKSSTSTTLGYTFSVALHKKVNKWDFAAHYTNIQFQQRFKFAETTSLNTFRYHMAGIQIGYSFIQKSIWRSEAAVNLDLQFSPKVNGYTLDENKTYSITKLDTTRNYRKLIPLLGISWNNIFTVSRKLDFLFSLQYKYELSTNTQKQEAYIEQRHLFIPKVGILFWLF